MTPEALTSDLRRFRARLRPALEAELERIGLEMAQHVTETIDEMGISNDGDLKKGIRPFVKAMKTQVRLRVAATARHSAPVFHGSKPHFPPIGPIRKWAKDKLGISAGETREEDVSFEANGEDVSFTATVNELDQAARAIAHKISQEGTEGQDYLTPTFEHFQGKIAPRLARAAMEAFEDA